MRAETMLFCQFSALGTSTTTPLEGWIRVSWDITKEDKSNPYRILKPSRMNKRGLQLDNRQLPTDKRHNGFFYKKGQKAYSRLLLSIQMVTGPSLTSSTCISAPNSPVATRQPESLRKRSTNRSYIGIAVSGRAARI